MTTTEDELVRGYRGAASGIWTSSADVTEEELEEVRPLLEAAMAAGSDRVERSGVIWSLRQLPATGVPVDIHRELRELRAELDEVRELLELVLAELRIDPDATS